MQYQDSRGRPLKPCRDCGGRKPPGSGHGYCEACSARRNAPTPCMVCGGSKTHGKHRLCDGCKATEEERRAERNRANARRRALADPEKNAARAKAWREANPERSRAVIDAWEEAHPEIMAAVRHRCTAVRRLRQEDAFVENVIPLVVLERDDGTCGICGGDVDPLNFHVDHIVPLARGGEHSYANVQVAHPACNARKGARLLTP